jgi:SAM-dependent methyltransferase
MLRCLSRHIWTVGVDIEPKALAFAQHKGSTNLIQVTEGNLPFKDCSFDLVCAFDVIEHLDDDSNALSEFYRVCCCGGHLMLTVPAYRFLWGQQDEISEHRRRYTSKELYQEIVDSGFIIKKLSYFNTFLFPLIAAIRLLRRLVPRSAKPDRVKSDFTMKLPKKINDLLSFAFAFEAFPLRGLDFPFGISLLCIAEKGQEKGIGGRAKTPQTKRNEAVR